MFFDYVFVSSVTGGTQAGMVAGFALHDDPRTVIGIDASAKPTETWGQIARIARATAKLIGVAREITDEEIILDDRFHAGTYGIPDHRTLEAMRLGASLEAMITDPVYEGKSLAGLIHMVQDREDQTGRQRPLRSPGRPTGPQCLRQSLSVTAVSDAFILTVPDSLIRGTLSELPSDVDVVEWSMKGPAPLERIDIVIPPYLQSLDGLAHLRGLDVRLVQSLTLGYDGVLEVLPMNMTYANAASVHETSTAEMTMALILASQRAIPEFVRASMAGKWSPTWRQSLADRSVLLVGYGGVGRAIEARLLPFETTVHRLARHERNDERGIVYGLEYLSELLPFSDIVVVAVPLDAETRHLVNAEFLSRMPDGSLFVNVSRGAVADTEALLAEARRGRLRLALDVTDPEPLPDGHPLFALENVLISPHVGGMSSAAMPRMARLIREQIDRLRSGQEPLNVVLRT